MRKRLTDLLEKTASSGGARRQIPDDYKYNSKKLKHLKHVLHNINVSVGTLFSSLNEFIHVKGPDISPDGNLGGYGYILPIKEIKQDLYQMIQKLGDISDCIADELTNPKWNASDDKEVKDLIKEKNKVEEKVEDINPDEDINHDEDVVTVYEDDGNEEKPLNKFSSDKDPVRTILSSEVKKALIKFSGIKE